MKSQDALHPEAQPEHLLPAVMVLRSELLAACGDLGKGLCRALQHRVPPPHHTISAEAQQPLWGTNNCYVVMIAFSCASSARQTRESVAGSQHRVPQVEGAALLQRGDHWIPGTGSPWSACGPPHLAWSSV